MNQDNNNFDPVTGQPINQQSQQVVERPQIVETSLKNEIIFE